jgi:hypothetical protein
MMARQRVLYSEGERGGKAVGRPGVAHNMLPDRFRWTYTLRAIPLVMLCMCVSAHAADNEIAMSQVKEAIANHRSDIQEWLKFTYQEYEATRVYNIWGKVVNVWGTDYDIVVADGKLYRSVVDVRQKPPKVIRSFPPEDMTRILEFDPNTPFYEIPELYRVDGSHDRECEGHPCHSIRMKPRADRAWPKNLARFDISMDIDTASGRLINVYYTARGIKSALHFKITRGTWLIDNLRYETTHGTFPHRYRYVTLHTYKYKRFETESAIIP